MENTVEKVYEQVAEANKSALEHAVRFNGIVTRTHNQLAEQHLALMESCLDSGVKQLEALADANDPKGLMSRQAELATQMGERLVAIVQRVMDIQGEARDEMTALFKEGVKAAEAKATARPPVAKEAKAAVRASAPAKEAKRSKGPTAAA